MTTIKEKYPDLYDIFKSKECVLIHYTKKSENLKYICKCGIEKQKLFKDFMKNKQCRTCTNKKLKEIPEEEEYTDENGELWKPIKGGWISSKGNCKNALNKLLILCSSKYRYHIDGKNQYVSRLVAEAFKIENYEKLDDPKYVVSHKDNNILNNSVENLKIITKEDVCSINGKKSRQSDTFKEKINWTVNKFKDIENKTIPELPYHKIYKNGEIWNGSRFLAFSKNENYLNLCTKDKTYKVHRLVCYAFNPIKGKEKLFDYDDLQVNHKDGNTLNNCSENLEWVSNSKNMYHSYTENLNKKVRNVLQYTLDGEYISEYISIAEASRQTDEPEHRIREIANGKPNSKAEYIWRFKNEEETKEYSEKYSKHVK
jgi:hypothetical protein